VFLLAAPLREAWLSGGSAGDSGEAPPAASAPAARGGEVRIESADQRRLGLVTSPVAAASAPALIHGFARGLDSANLAAIDAEIVTTRAAAAASRAEADRLALLAAQDQSASVKSVQAARAQAGADAARALLATRRVGLEYGPGLARLPDGARRALIADIASGAAALVRVDIPGAAITPAAAVRIDNGSGSLRVLGPASSVDPRLQSAGMLAILRGPAAASAANGGLLGVTVEQGGAQSGIVIARDAVVRWRSGLWVYRLSGTGTFQRVELIEARPTTDGWFVPSGLAADDRVVTRGAGTLLAMDRGSGVADVGED
jgi:hypothetical protein